MNYFKLKFLNKFRDITISSCDVRRESINSNYFGYFITNKNEFLSIGSNNRGQLGLGHNKIDNNINEIKTISGLKIQEIIDGYSCIFVITHDDVIFAWGANRWGQLLIENGRNKVNKFIKPMRIKYFDGKNIYKIAAGDYHYLALSKDGCLYMWGLNHKGQIGERIETDYPTIPIKFKISDIKSIYCFQSSSFAVTNCGMIYFWGEDLWNITKTDAVCESSLYYKFKLFDNIICDQIICNKNRIYYTYNGELKLFPNLNVIHKNIGELSINYNKQIIGYDGNQVLYIEEEKFINTKYITFIQYYIEKYSSTYGLINIVQEDLYKDSAELMLTNEKQNFMSCSKKFFRTSEFKFLSESKLYLDCIKIGKNADTSMEKESKYIFV
jgi:hypothetical protein